MDTKVITDKNVRLGFKYRRARKRLKDCLTVRVREARIHALAQAQSAACFTCEISRRCNQHPGRAKSPLSLSMNSTHPMPVAKSLQSPYKWRRSAKAPLLAIAAFLFLGFVQDSFAQPLTELLDRIANPTGSTPTPTPEPEETPHAGPSANQPPGQTITEPPDSPVHNLAALISNIWNLPLGDRITLGTLLIGLLSLGVAILISLSFSRTLSSWLTRRFRIHQGQAHLLERLFFYFLSLILVLTTLQWLQIPLTVFAFLGGALMVGIGFGSQNLMNNFISGLILMLEQKIKVGDIVEVEGNLGKVLNLGSRCSTIQKFDGVEILVPNSILLEKNVVNWTLSDPQHRFDFTLGVAYESPIEKVLEILLKSMKQQPEILTEPAPVVFFEEFGNSTLNFRLYYWLLIGQCDARQVGSEIRMRINRLCRENEIEIAFPQRDVHLKFPGPLPVEIAKPNEKPTSGPPSFYSSGTGTNPSAK